MGLWLRVAVRWIRVRVLVGAKAEARLGGLSLTRLRWVSAWAFGTLHVRV